MQPQLAEAGVPSGYTEFYVPGDTDQLFQIFRDIDNDPCLGNAFGGPACGEAEANEMHSVVSVAIAADNVTVYYDHWENGYGVGTAADETYTGNTGDVFTFESSDMVVPRGVGDTCTSTNANGASTDCYDGRDRIYVVGGTVTVGRASWPEVTDTVFALAWEVYPVKPYLTNYVIPVGEDLASGATGYNDFTNTYVSVQSTTDGNSVQIDDPNVPGLQFNGTLNQGVVYTEFNIDAGTLITASAPVQVQFVVGQAHGGLYSESRGFTAVPSGLWDSSYYNPVPGFANTGTNLGEDTEIYIFNPTDSTLTVNYEDSVGSGSFTVPANSTRSYSSFTGRTVPEDSAVYLAAADGTTDFWAIGSGGTSNVTTTGNANYDYGFSLVPTSLLKNEYFLSWTPGSSNLTQNGSPVFVTPTEDNVTIFVDYDPSTPSIDDTYVLNRIEMQRLYDTTDNDMSGAHVWSNAPIAMVWGQDPDQAANTSPYLDVGYTSLPLPEAWMDVVMTLNKTADPTSIEPSPGQVVNFTLTAATDTTYEVDDIDVVDVLPTGWSYVADSTIITVPGGGTSTPNPVIVGQTLTWSVGVNLPANEAFTLEYQAVYDGTALAPFGCNDATVIGTRNSGAEDHEATDQACVYYSDLEMEKNSSAAGNAVSPGDTIDYTVVITNSGGTVQNNIVVSDTLPVGTTYVPNSTFVTAPVAGLLGTVGDAFNAIAFDGNQDSNGALVDPSWGSDWIEVGEGDGPNAGDVRVLNDISNYQLRIQDNNNGGEGVRRDVSLSGCDTAELSFVYRRQALDDANDYVRLSIGTGGSLTDNLQDFAGPGTDAVYQSYSVDITNWIDAQTRIQLLTSASMGNNDIVYFDDVLISCYSSSLGTNPGHSPPGLVVAGDGYSLGSGETMTVTYQVTVDYPLAVDQTTIVNTASVTSDENNVPLEDTTTDPVALGSIGNYVWLDENGDGVQDAGESGIANVVVELYDVNNTLVLTTTTDANGGYIFPDIPSGVYTARVDTTSMPAGLAANPTYDEDDGTTSPDASTVVTLSSDGQEHLSADFGFNWVSPTDSSTPPSGATGAIGDRIWIDANGDGNQDPGEAGISGVTVSLLTDDNGDGIYGGTGDNPATTTTTDAAGNYIFDGLPPSSYVVQVTPPAGYTQTGDPDGTLDNQTSSPVVLAPGDVYVNADFGYQPNGSSSTIGDTLFVDADSDGVQDAGEPGIPGVTVALLDNSGNVIATTTTDANGNYSFPGLPAGTYTVQVTDTEHVLGDLDPVSDADGGNDNQSTTTVDGSADDLDQDFGYAPPGHNPNDGLIGDTIFLDINNDGFTAGEGIEGVVVNLYDSTGTTLLATTITNENGQYFFGGLLATDTYQVHVNTSSLPNGGAGLTNSVDPDGGFPSQSIVDLGATGPVDLNQDFGYTADTPNTIGGTVWEDSDADGELDEPSSGVAGVTVVLRDSSGNVVATTTTDGNGDYSFPGLPNGTYTVDVTDDDNVLNGTWHSIGASPGSDNNSQVDPYTVAVSGGATNTTGDFGYYRDPAALGDFVWEDFNGNGLQDGGEPVIPGVEVLLTITYPNGDVVTVTTTTDASGNYSFGNLLLDEDYNGVGDDQPSYEISIPLNQLPLAGYGATSIGSGNDDTINSNDPNGAVANPVQGTVDNDTDFGYVRALSLAGTVWNDSTSNNSVFNPGTDAPIPGTTVELWSDTDGDDVPDALVATTVTDSDGNYIFNGLDAGDYIVVIPTAPVGLPNSAAGAGAPNDDIRYDDNGYYNGGLPSGRRFLSRHITLEPLDGSQDGVEPAAGVDDDNNRSNRTLDFGFTNSPTAVTLNQFSANNNVAAPVGLIVVISLILVAGSFIIIRRRKVMD